MGCSPSTAGRVSIDEAARTHARTAAADDGLARQIGGSRPVQLSLDNDIPNEVLLHVCSFLRVRELGRLECVSRRFAIVSACSASGRRWFPPRTACTWSIVREACRRRVASGSDVSRNNYDPDVVACVAHSQLCSSRCYCYPRWHHPLDPLKNNDWLRLLYEAELLRTPLAFDRADSTVTVSNDGTMATKKETGATVLASNKVMRAGRHFAEFTIMKRDNVTAGRCGLVRPLAAQREAYIAGLRRLEAKAAADLAAAIAAHKLADDGPTAAAAMTAVAAAEATLSSAAESVRAAGRSCPDIVEALVVGEPLFYQYDGYNERANFDSVHPDHYHPEHYYYRHEGDRIGLCLDLEPPFAGDLAVRMQTTTTQNIQSYQVCVVHFEYLPQIVVACYSNSCGKTTSISG